MDGVNRQLRYFSEKLLIDLIGDLPPSVSALRISMAQALLTQFDKEFFTSLRDEYLGKKEQQA